jgi:hypothetical protein
VRMDESQPLAWAACDPLPITPRRGIPDAVFRPRLRRLSGSGRCTR